MDEVGSRLTIIVSVVPMAGHVGPVSGLVAELVRRRHDVRVYTAARYRERFTALGAGVVPWAEAEEYDENDLGGSFPLARRVPALRGIALVKDGFIGTAAGQVRDLARELERAPADVLVADSMSFGGVLTAELLELPWAMLNVLPFNSRIDTDAAPPGRTRPAAGPLGRQRNRLGWLAYRAMTFPLTRAYNRIRQEVGLPRDPRPYGSVLFSNWLVLATGCPSLEPGLDVAAQVRYVGRLEPAGLTPPPLAARRPSGRPLVVVTQGTTDLEYADLIRPALLGLANLDVDVIATTGRRGHPDVGSVPPANARVVDLLDFGKVLHEASAFVTNGGWGGVLASLAAGVPVVVAPRGAADKPHIARRMAKVGVGVNLGAGGPKPAAVAAAVREVLTDSRFAARARQVGAELEGLGGAGAAADLLEELARLRVPLRS
jgi:UDP:flavonoid glycosyltransferase YjiC (YdhE family)